MNNPGYTDPALLDIAGAINYLPAFGSGMKSYSKHVAPA